MGFGEWTPAVQNQRAGGDVDAAGECVRGRQRQGARTELGQRGGATGIVLNANKNATPISERGVVASRRHS